MSQFKSYTKNAALAGLTSLALLGGLFAVQAQAESHSSGGSMMNETTVEVGGAPMLPSKTLAENAVNSGDHTTLVAAVQAAGLLDAIAGEGPITVFGPVNNAFEDLPEGTVANLLKPENKDTLVAVLTYHVVAGAWTRDSLMEKLEATGGAMQVESLSGGSLTIKLNGPSNIMIEDANGGSANISVYDVMQSNGVFHSIDAVLLP